MQRSTLLDTDRMNTQYITFNPDGTPTGVGSTVDGTIFPGALVCTAEQAQNWQAYTNVNGVLTENQGIILANAQSAQISALKQSWAQALAVVPVTINGTEYQIDNSPARQTANINLAMSIQTIMSQAPAWKASTAVAAGSYCNLNGAYLYCSTAGTTGSSAPTAPTTFGTPVTDGTAAWELLGRHVWLENGTMQLFTPQQVLSGAMQIEAYIHKQTVKLDGLMEQVKAAATVEEVQSVTW